MLPDFSEHGTLPAGDYLMTLTQLRESILVKGSANLPNWDTNWRQTLVQNLEILVSQLWEVGITKIFVNGSFTEDKDHPNDIDGYFICDLREFASRQLEQRLNAIDPYQIWTWDRARRRPYRGSTKLQLPMWHQYRVELYPHYGTGPTTGIRDEFGNDQMFPAAFRKSRRDHRQKGIIKIIKEEHA
jgi:hypothetical protein